MSSAGHPHRHHPSGVTKAHTYWAPGAAHGHAHHAHHGHHTTTGSTYADEMNREMARQNARELWNGTFQLGRGGGCGQILTAGCMAVVGTLFAICAGSVGVFAQLIVPPSSQSAPHDQVAVVAPPPAARPVRQAPPTTAARVPPPTTIAAAPTTRKAEAAPPTTAAKEPPKEVVVTITPPPGGAVVLAGSKLVLKDATEYACLRLKWSKEGAIRVLTEATAATLVSREPDVTRVKLDGKEWLVESAWVSEKR